MVSLCDVRTDYFNDCFFNKCFAVMAQVRRTESARRQRT
jgi:hypothetical protein